MNFSQFLNIILQIFNSVISWLLLIFNTLYQNFVFKIIFFLSIFIVVWNLLIRIFNLGSNYKIEYDDFENSDSEFWEEE